MYGGVCTRHAVRRLTPTARVSAQSPLPVRSRRVLPKATLMMNAEPVPRSTTSAWRRAPRPEEDFSAGARVPPPARVTLSARSLITGARGAKQPYGSGLDGSHVLHVSRGLLIDVHVSYHVREVTDCFTFSSLFFVFLQQASLRSYQVSQTQYTQNSSHTVVGARFTSYNGLIYSRGAWWRAFLACKVQSVCSRPNVFFSYTSQLSMNGNGFECTSGATVCTSSAAVTPSYPASRPFYFPCSKNRCVKKKGLRVAKAKGCIAHFLALCYFSALQVAQVWETLASLADRACTSIP